MAPKTITEKRHKNSIPPCRPLGFTNDPPLLVVSHACITRERFTLLVSVALSVLAFFTLPTLPVRKQGMVVGPDFPLLKK